MKHVRINNQRLIARIRSMLKSAIDVGHSEEILRLGGLLTYVQSEYIKELEKVITDARLRLSFYRSNQAS